MKICFRLVSISGLLELVSSRQCIGAYDYRGARFYFVGEPERGVAAAGVFAPDGPKELGGPTSP
jgi:hypothetical protein